MSIATYCKLFIGIIIMGFAIAVVHILLQSLYGLQHRSYVEYSNDPEKKASVYIYRANRRYKGYRMFPFFNKKGKWKYKIESKTITYILIALAVLSIIEIVSLGISGYLELSVVLPALLLNLFFATIILAIPLGDIVQAYSALDDDLRKQNDRWEGE